MQEEKYDESIKIYQRFLSQDLQNDTFISGNILTGFHSGL
jgi:hypothetical protein